MTVKRQSWEKDFRVFSNQKPIMSVFMSFLSMIHDTVKVWRHVAFCNENFGPTRLIRILSLDYVVSGHKLPDLKKSTNILPWLEVIMHQMDRPGLFLDFFHGTLTGPNIHKFSLGNLFTYYFLLEWICMEKTFTFLFAIELCTAYVSILWLFESKIMPSAFSLWTYIDLIMCV